MRKGNNGWAQWTKTSVNGRKQGVNNEREHFLKCFGTKTVSIYICSPGVFYSISQ